jgi:hypothetical protein
MFQIWVFSFSGGVEAVLGFELSTPHLLSRTLPFESWPQPFFASVIFQSWSCVFAWCQTQTITLLYTTLHTGITDMCHHIWLIDWNRALLTFCTCWPWISVLLISTSQTARIIGMNHGSRSKLGVFKFWNICGLYWLSTPTRKCKL